MSQVLHVVCPHCQAINWLPEARLSQQPSCGRCHKALFLAQPMTLNASNFDSHAGRGDLPLLVDFWAPWCGPCLQMAPQFAAAAKELEPRVRLGKLDTEAEPVLGARFAVRSIPTLALFHQGRELAREAGARSAQAIVAWVRAHLSA